MKLCYHNLDCLGETVWPGAIRQIYRLKRKQLFCLRWLIISFNFILKDISHSLLNKHLYNNLTSSVVHNGYLILLIIYQSFFYDSINIHLRQYRNDVTIMNCIFKIINIYQHTYNVRIYRVQTFSNQKSQPFDIWWNTSRPGLEDI